MPKTAEAVVDASGQIRLLEALPLREHQRVLVTVLDEDASAEEPPSGGNEADRGDMIGRLMREPLRCEGFEPLSREEAHRRV